MGPSTFSKNRDRLLSGHIASKFFYGVVERARTERLLSCELFTVDGTLLEARASQKGFQPKDEDAMHGGGTGRNGESDFRGEKRSNRTHASTTDPDARLARKKSKEARLYDCASVLMENRSRLLVDAEATHATGRAEVETAWRCWSDRRRARDAVHWEPTSSTTPTISSRAVERWASRLTWLRTPAAATAQSTAEPHGMTATR